MHVLQFTYSVARGWSHYAWLQEYTSTWAEHYVFTSDNLEQEDADSPKGIPPSLQGLLVTDVAFAPF